MADHNRPPLWEMMHDAYWKAADMGDDIPPPCTGECFAAEIRAIAEELESNQRFLVDGYNLSPEGKAIAAWLLAEADRAEAGE